MPTNNTISGTPNADNLVGTALNDRIDGYADNDTLSGLDGDDELDGGAGVDTMSGGLGDDVYFLNDALDVVIENMGEGEDEVRIASAFSSMPNSGWVLPDHVENLTLNSVGRFYGNALSNVIDATSAQGGAELYGMDGNDTIIAGNVGMWYLDGGTGADVLMGSAHAINYFVVDNQNDVIVTHDPSLTTTDNMVRVEGAINFTSPGFLRTIAAINSAGAANLTGDASINEITGNDAPNQLRGLGGNDTIYGGRGDTISGGDGNDHITIWPNGTGLIVIEAASSGDSNNTLTIPIDYSAMSLTQQGADLYIQGVDAFTHNPMEIVIRGELTQPQFSAIQFAGQTPPLVSLTPAMIQSALQPPQIDGTVGNDVLAGTSGADILRGLAGDDLYTVNHAGDQVLEDPAAGTDTVQASVNYSLPDNVENLTLTGAAGLTGTGNAYNNVIHGTLQNDVLQGGGGQDQLFGQAGNDQLQGGAGDDVLQGLSGNDQLDGGAGNDRYLFTPYMDHDTVVAAAPGDMMNSIVFQGVQLADLVFTQDGDDLLITFQPDYPNASIYDASMRVVGQYGQNGPQINSLEFVDVNQVTYLAVPFGLFNGWVNTPMVHGTSADDVLMGTPASDVLFGHDGNDTINGQGSGDLMVGGRGHDLYVVDHLADRILELAGEGDDTVQTSESYTLPNQLENLTLMGSAALTGIGNAANNTLDASAATSYTLTLNGGAGNDHLIAGLGTLTSLDGGTGADVMVGSSTGHSTFYVDDVGDQVQAHADGFNTVHSTINYQMGANQHNLHLQMQAVGGAGTGNALGNGIWGSQQNDTLYGMAGDDVLQGLNGDDHLHGGDGQDALHGGGGDDVLVGGDGDDTYYYVMGQGSDTILAAQLGDTNNTLVVQNADLQALSFVQSGQDLIISGPPPAAPVAPDGAQQTLPQTSGVVISGHFSPGGSGISTLQIVSPSGVTQTFSSAQFSSWVNGSVYHGTPGDDTYIGTPDDESIYGYGGNDSLVGGEGNDLTDGGDGDDVYLTGGAGDNVVYGRAGDDVIWRTYGNDVLDGGAGNDIFNINAEVGGLITIASAAGDSNNTLNWYFGMASAFRYFRQGYDLVITVEYSQGTQPLGTSMPDYSPVFPQYGIVLRVEDQFRLGYEQIATMHNYAIGTTQTFTAGQLTTMAVPIITGTAGADTLVGNVGNDVLVGLDGNDTLIGSTGADAMYGQSGDDWYQVDNVGDTTVERPGEGSDTVSVLFLPEWTLSAEIEHLSLNPFSTLGVGNGLNNTINGSMAVTSSLTLHGLAGDDVLTAGYGADHLYGGAGNDTLNGGAGADTFYFEAGGGQDVVVAPLAGDSGNTLVLVNLDPAHISYTQQGLDLLVSYTPPSQMQALASNGPQATAPAPTTMLVTGQFDPNGANVTSFVFQQNGITTQTLNAADVAALISGGTSNTQGDAGANRLEGTAGADTMTGLGGSDTYLVNHAGDQVVEAVDEGADTIESSLTLTLPVNVENLILTGSADLAGSGNDLANQLTGNGGSNWLSGEAGNDTLRGGAGNDDIRGGDGGDLLYGEDGDDVLDGGVGADFMAGGAGNDRYTVSEAGDVIDEVAGGGVDTVVASGDYVLYANLENLELLAGAVNGSGNAGSNWIIGNAQNNWIGGGAGGDTIFGRDGNDAINGDDDNDVLYGEGGDDVLDGGAGNDELIGGVGNDRYIIRDLGDTIAEDAAGGVDTAEVHVDNYVPFANVENVILAAGILSASGSSADNWMEGNTGNNFLGGGVGHDALFGFDGNDYLKGDDGDDRLEGGAGNDVLEGNAGVDTMVGGDGDDIYYVDGPGDITVETATGGVDTVYSSGFYTLSGNLENLVIIGTQAVDGTGDAGSNWMQGNASSNVLSGMTGNDVIYGGDGADTISGGAGSDVLDGQAGGDTYVYALGDGDDVITDTDATAGVDDLLNLTGIARSLLSLTRVADNLVIGINDPAQAGSVTINNWFAGSQHQIEQIVDADGTRAAAVISALAAAPAPMAPLAAAAMLAPQEVMLAA